MTLDGYQFVALLIGIGVVLSVAEALLPTHGILGLLGGGSVACAIVAAARVSPWAGIALLVAAVAALPLLWVAFVHYWPRTPLGRRIVMQPLESPPPTLAVRVGQTGVAVSELRPMGLCEFDGTRVEAISEHGIIEPGTDVKVVALSNNRPTVRIT
jgi:membrane-bound serine protease (ClpP class)